MAAAPPPPPPPPNAANTRAERRVAREQDRLRQLNRRSSSVLGPILLLVLGVLFLRC